MGYWRIVLGYARRGTKAFTPVRAIPSILASLYFVPRDDLGAMSRWVEASVVLLGSYLVLWVIEFLYHLFVVAPRKIYDKTAAEMAARETRIARLEVELDQRSATHPPELVARVKALLERSPATRSVLDRLMRCGEMDYAQLENTPGGPDAFRSGAIVVKEFPKEPGKRRPPPRCVISDLYKPILQDVLYGPSTGAPGSQPSSKRDP